MQSSAVDHPWLVTPGGPGADERFGEVHSRDGVTGAWAGAAAMAAEAICIISNPAADCYLGRLWSRQKGWPAGSA